MKGEAKQTPPAYSGQGVPSAESILDAAEKLMAARGYDATSVAAVCRDSSLPVGSFYHHFGSKAGVLSAVMQRGVSRFYEEMAEVVPPGETAEERMRLYYERAPELMLRNVSYLRILHRSLSGSDNAAWQLGRNTHQFVSEALAGVIEPVAVMAGVEDPAALARSLGLFSSTYASGAVMMSAYEQERLEEIMAPLYDLVRTKISAAAQVSVS